MLFEKTDLLSVADNSVAHAVWGFQGFQIYLHSLIIKYTLGQVSSRFPLAHVEDLSAIDLASVIKVVKGFVKGYDRFICASNLLHKI